MRYDRGGIKRELTEIAATENPHKDTAQEALAYIRHLEGELRRQGFTDYTEKEDTNG